MQRYIKKFTLTNNFENNFDFIRDYFYCIQ